MYACTLMICLYKAMDACTSVKDGQTSSVVCCFIVLLYMNASRWGHNMLQDGGTISPVNHGYEHTLPTQRQGT
uniref:Uncharacterized protein n=1 Tax=Arundo donax TaxID=35708 RepID=A0A0A9GLB4_ARUDO